jgi:hypothetical protein
MTLEEINEYCFLNSNQYFVGQDNIEMKTPILQGIIKRALKHYGNYRPIQYRNKLTIPSNKIIKDFDGRKIETIREIYMIDPLISGFEDGKIPMPYEFNQRTKTLLMLMSSGGETYIVDALVRPILDDITYDDELFLDMVLGQYMMYIGESRKAFALSDLPFENDGSEIYADGKELFENALEELKEENSTWWYAIT